MIDEHEGSSIVEKPEVTDIEGRPVSYDKLPLDLKLTIDAIRSIANGGAVVQGDDQERASDSSERGNRPPMIKINL